ncbi:FAD-binding monooxygenase [Ancylobacter sonchi]
MVIGAGIAGLCAARVLAPFFPKVVIVERDGAERFDDARPGMPGFLLGGGYAGLSELFPGIGADLLIAGGVRFDAGDDIRLESPEIGALPPRRMGWASYGVTRPTLERVIAQRTARWPNIVFHHNRRVTALRLAEGGARVDGIRCRLPDGTVEHLDAELVIDASGRPDLTLACTRTGDPAPAGRLAAGLGLAVATFRLPATFNPGFVGLATLPAPRSSRCGTVLRVGEERWQVVLAAREDERPAADEASFCEFAGTLPTPAVGAFLRRTRRPEQLGGYRLREAIWHRLDESHLPAGLLPVGDTMCRLDPIFGQGLTVAILQALLLRNVLAAAPQGGTQLAIRRFLERSNVLVERAWEAAATRDALFRAPAGAPSPQRLAAQDDNWREARRDPAAHEALLRQFHLLGLVGDETVSPQNAA